MQVGLPRWIGIHHRAQHGFNILALTLSLAALVLSGLSWRATHAQAREAERARLLLEEQLHEQAKPDLRFELGIIPDQGWIPVNL